MHPWQGLCSVSCLLLCIISQAGGFDYSQTANVGIGISLIKLVTITPDDEVGQLCTFIKNAYKHTEFYISVATFSGDPDDIQLLFDFDKRPTEAQIDEAWCNNTLKLTSNSGAEFASVYLENKIFGEYRLEPRNMAPQVFIYLRPSDPSNPEYFYRLMTHEHDKVDIGIQVHSYSKKEQQYIIYKNQTTGEKVDDLIGGDRVWTTVQKLVDGCPRSYHKESQCYYKIENGSKPCAKDVSWTGQKTSKYCWQYDRVDGNIYCKEDDCKTQCNTTAYKRHTDCNGTCDYDTAQGGYYMEVVESTDKFYAGCPERLVPCTITCTTSTTTTIPPPTTPEPPTTQPQPPATQPQPQPETTSQTTSQTNPQPDPEPEPGPT